MEKNKITEELNEMGSMLAKMPKVVPYEVPQDYFKDFSSGIMFGISSKESFSTILPTDTEQAMSVPEGYFNKLPEQILQKAKAAEGIIWTKANPYIVPEGYFDDLATRMIWGIKEEDVAKRKTIPLGAGIRKATQWLAAALLILGIGFGSYKFLNRPDVNPAQELASVPSSTLEEYLQATDNYVEIPESVAGDVRIHKQELKQLTDAELISYLNETGLETSTIN
jgi:hypothetical protein